MIKQFTSYTQQIGEKGEEIAVTHLKRAGYTIVNRNISNKYGEIDIIAKKSKVYYFYEVKTGRQGSWFNPAENMTQTKIRKFLVSVEHYCLVHKVTQYRACALTVKLVESPAESTIETLELS